MLKLRNKYLILRHGQTIYQTKKKDFIYPSEAKGEDENDEDKSSSSSFAYRSENEVLIDYPSEAKGGEERMFFDYPPFPEKPLIKLTKRGERQIKTAAKKLTKAGIDLIFSSDFFRTKQTAKIMAKELGLKIILDKRLRDVNLGIYRGRLKEEFYQDFPDPKKRFSQKPKGGESWSDCQKRMLNFLKEIDRKYRGKTILIVSHGHPLWLLEGAIKGLTNQELLDERYLKKNYIEVGGLRKLK